MPVTDQSGGLAVEPRAAFAQRLEAQDQILAGQARPDAGESEVSFAAIPGNRGPLVWPRRRKSAKGGESPRLRARQVGRVDLLAWGREIPVEALSERFRVRGVDLVQRIEEGASGVAIQCLEFIGDVRNHAGSESAEPDDRARATLRIGQ